MRRFRRAGDLASAHRRQAKAEEQAEDEQPGRDIAEVAEGRRPEPARDGEKGKGQKAPLGQQSGALKTEVPEAHAGAVHSPAPCGFLSDAWLELRDTRVNES